MLETLVSFAAHGNRLLISQGAVNIWIYPDELRYIIGSAGVAMMDSDDDFPIGRGDEELVIPYRLLGEFIYQATLALRDPGLVH